MDRDAAALLEERDRAEARRDVRIERERHRELRIEDKPTMEE